MTIDQVTNILLILEALGAIILVIIILNNKATKVVEEGLKQNVSHDRY